MKKILTVIGARPQFIKASVVSHEIKNHAGLSEIIVHTGQHYDHNMSDVFFNELGMPSPDYHLGVSAASHGEMTGRMLIEIERVLFQEKPDIVLVYGDTNSTLAGALAASKLHIPIAHIEAGLRSFNMKMPEEINRIVTDRLSSLLFAPTEVAVEHLIKEGVTPDNILNVGDVMYDVALHHGDRVKDHGGLLAAQKLDINNYVLVTIHRAENTDNSNRLKAIIKALQKVAEDIQVVWPIHPRTYKVLEKEGLLDLLSKVRLLDPLGYLDMVQLEKYAAIVATDSGGVQKEAFFHRIPCVTVRDETEWVELVNSGWNQLVSPLSSSEISEKIFSSIGKKGDDISPYGMGNAANLIVSSLVSM